MLLIDAVYIHESGGKSLLEYLLTKAIENKFDFFLLGDKRLKTDLLHQIPSGRLLVMAASEKNRRSFYRSNLQKFSSVFCFANVPPPVAVEKKTLIYFQNTLLLSGFFEKNGYPLLQKLGFWIKRQYITRKKRNTYTWAVQTASMRSRLQQAMSVAGDRVLVLPFYSVGKNETVARVPGMFLYVADGVAQKNHNTLFDAWEQLLNNDGLTPTLHVTIPQNFEQLINRIEDLNVKGVMVVNHGRVEKSELNALFEKAQYLIFPSLSESFGLPLIEAAVAGCGIIAADLPYVQEVVEPNASFDPYNSLDIAATVKKILAQPWQPATLIVRDHIDDLLSFIYLR